MLSLLPPSLISFDLHRLGNPRRELLMRGSCLNEFCGAEYAQENNLFYWAHIGATQEVGKPGGIKIRIPQPLLLGWWGSHFQQGLLWVCRGSSCHWNPTYRLWAGWGAGALFSGLEDSELALFDLRLEFEPGIRVSPRMLLGWALFFSLPVYGLHALMYGEGGWSSS